MAASKKGTKSKTSSRKASARRRPSAGRGDKSVEAFRNALERSLVLSRERLQEAVDDAVKRGRMTRGDANELVSNLVTRGRQQTDDLMKELERLLDQARREIETRARPARRQARSAAGRAARAARDVADAPLAQADRIRRRAGVRAGGPVTAYDQLTVPQIRSRLKELTKDDLRKVRTQEKRGKARRGILDDIERRLK
jgi:polyhydroxyalkanoate synthesis regulator phasin